MDRFEPRVLALAAMRKELSKQGRTGLGVMDEVLAVRGPDYIPPANGVEGRFHEIIARDGQVPMTRQVQVHDPGERGWLGCVERGVGWG